MFEGGLWPTNPLSYESVTEATNNALLSNNAVISGLFIAAKTLAVAFVMMTWLKEYLQGVETNGQKLPITISSILLKVLYIIVILQFNVVTDYIDQGLGAYESAFNVETSQRMYSIGEDWMEEFENEIMEEEEQKGWFGRAWDTVRDTAKGFTRTFDVWYWLLQICKFIAWCVNSMVYPIFLIERGFLLVVMKLALPLILALGVLPAYKTLVTKWILLYCAIFLTGLFFIMATQFCDAVYAIMVNNIHVGIVFWAKGLSKTLIFLVIAFAKVKLYRGAVDLSYKIFNV